MIAFLRRRAARSAAQAGFSLVETLVAMGIAVTATLGLLGASIFAVNATVTARQNQQAGDYLNQALEQVRALPYGGVAMVTSDLAGDAAITTSGGVQYFNPGTGAEAVDARTSGSINPHVVTSSTSNGTYTVKRYVTVPASTPVDAQGIPAVRRVTVVVSWSHGATRTRTASTMVTATRRGLPLPNYQWLYNGSAPVLAGRPTETKNPGNDVSFGFALTNLGARDSWLLSSSTSGWTFHVDTDQDGVWDDVGTEPALTASTTPLLEPGQAVPYYVVAHRVIGTAENGTTTTTFSAASVSQPSYTAKSVTTTLTVTAGTVVPPTPTPSATPSSTVSATPCNAGSSTGVLGDMSTTSTTTKPNNSYTTTRLNLANGPARGGHHDPGVEHDDDGCHRPAAPAVQLGDQHADRRGRQVPGRGRGRPSRSGQVALPADSHEGGADRGHRGPGADDAVPLDDPDPVCEAVFRWGPVHHVGLGQRDGSQQLQRGELPARRHPRNDHRYADDRQDRPARADRDHERRGAAWLRQ